MSGTLTIIVGLCGSGKSWLLKKLHRSHPKAKVFDEGVSDCGYWKKQGIEKREKIARYLARGYDVYVADLWCGWKPRRKAVLWHIRKFVPDLRVVWLFFKTNLRVANNNCRLRERGHRDPKGHIRINNRWAKRLTAPKDAIIMEIHRLK